MGPGARVSVTFETETQGESGQPDHLIVKHPTIPNKYVVVHKETITKLSEPIERGDLVCGIDKDGDKCIGTYWGEGIEVAGGGKMIIIQTYQKPVTRVYVRAARLVCKAEHLQKGWNE